MSESTPLLAARGMNKAFPGVQALSGVDFTLERGEIHALLGENGAGKSTLIKVLTGVYLRDSGSVHLDAKPIEARSPHHAQSLGISTVYQEVNLVPELSVMENIYLGRESPGLAPWMKNAFLVVATLAGVILGLWRTYADFGAAHFVVWLLLGALMGVALGAAAGGLLLHLWAFAVKLVEIVTGKRLTARRRAEAAMARLDMNIDVSRPVSSYSLAIQQMVAIARALDVQAKVLILDEPTSSLDKDEVAELFRMMKKLAAEGLGIVFVTHFLDQVYAVTNRITILRNGKLVGSFATANLPRLELVGHMLGRDPKEVTAMHDRAVAAEGAAAHRTLTLRARKLGRRGAVKPFDLDIHEGEVVGLAGLLGSGRTEIARLFFGIDQADEGELEIGRHRASMKLPAWAGRGRLGRMILFVYNLFFAFSPAKASALAVGFCPEDRKIAAIIPDLSVRENIILALQARRGWLRPISRRKQDELAAKYIKALNIATPDAEKSIKFLSGGNQQKAILGRWLACAPKLLILDEPTRGIDIGAKFEIAKLMEELCREGMSLLFISSELEEVVRSCQRVVVLRDREKIAELTADKISLGNIMATIAGGAPQSAAA